MTCISNTHYHSERDDFTLKTQHGGVDQIIESKSPINIEDLLTPEYQEGITPHTSWAASHMGGLTPAQPGGLTLHSTPWDFNTCTSWWFNPCTPRGLTPSHLGGLTPAQLGVLTPAHLGVLTPAQPGVLTPAHLGGLTPAQPGGLTHIWVVPLHTLGFQHLHI